MMGEKSDVEKKKISHKRQREEFYLEADGLESSDLDRDDETIQALKTGKKLTARRLR
ncbi:MAG: hypothetical protein GX779_07780 [Clostridia bacterium]|jgi:hypothetical protein|nr:hypothetical protein [Clostridia bacterium]